MNNRLFQKIFFTVSLSTIIGILMVFALLSVTVSSYLVDEKKELLSQNCTTISNVLSNQKVNTDGFYISLDGVIRVVSNTVLGDVYVSDKDGHIFLCSCEEYKEFKACNHSKGVISQKITDELNENGSFFEVGHLSERLNNIYYTSAKPFYNEDKSVAGYVFISSPASQLKEMWTEFSKIIIWCMIIPISVMFIFLYFIIGKITKRIENK